MLFKQKNTFRNLFKEIGKSDAEINEKLKSIIDEVFFGENKIYFTNADDTGYVVDTGNNDVRTEGMSYAMMVFVQLDMKEDFDRIWRWVMKYMYIDEGVSKGYFAWSVCSDGVRLSNGPAPDGEEYFAMALYFASKRWGDGEDIFNYSKCATDILHACVHKGENNDGYPMWNPDNKLIKFVPNMEISDPSYHLPHFYALFAEFAQNENDKNLWEETTFASLEYLKKSCHPKTGLAAEYADYDGVPYNLNNHHLFYSDSYRVASNIGLMCEWFDFGKDFSEWANDNIVKIHNFFLDYDFGLSGLVYETDGTVIDEPALHPIGLLSTNAQAALAVTKSNENLHLSYIEKFWNTPPRQGVRRYYDNFLHVFAFLALSGNYRIY